MAVVVTAARGCAPEWNLFQARIKNRYRFTLKEKHIPANIVKFEADLIKKTMLLCVLVEIGEALEMSFVDRPVVGSGERNVSADTSGPLVNNTFDLKNGRHS